MKPKCNYFSLQVGLAPGKTWKQSAPAALPRARRPGAPQQKPLPNVRLSEGARRPPGRGGSGPPPRLGHSLEQRAPVALTQDGARQFSAPLAQLALPVIPRPALPSANMAPSRPTLAPARTKYGGFPSVSIVPASYALPRWLQRLRLRRRKDGGSDCGRLNSSEAAKAAHKEAGARSAGRRRHGLAAGGRPDAAGGV